MLSLRRYFSQKKQRSRPVNAHVCVIVYSPSFLLILTKMQSED